MCKGELDILLQDVVDKVCKGELDILLQDVVDKVCKGELDILFIIDDDLDIKLDKVLRELWLGDGPGEEDLVLKTELVNEGNALEDTYSSVTVANTPDATTDPSLVNATRIYGPFAIKLVPDVTLLE